MTSHVALLGSVSRRATLAGMAGFALIAALPSPLFAQTSNETFRHGVASGDPDASSVVLWTRISGTASPVDVEWELAADRAFNAIILSGKVPTGPDRDHTVKVLAEGLPAGGTFWYRFRANGNQSPVGRTRTLPVGRLDRLGIALASCSNYAFGFFNAYDAIASDAEVDFVLHTGDYIYEYGPENWGAETGRRIGRLHVPTNEIVSLADYRQRHAQYKTDAGSRAMHAAHPLLACWDDHESANDPWTGGAQNHQEDTEGRWEDRRAASIRAYFEWMPVREPGINRSRMQFWRGYSFGDLATLFTLETRHNARAEQIEYGEAIKARIKSMDEARAFERESFNAAGRPLLAPELEADLDAALRRSVAMRQPWRLIGNPMPIARMRVPDVVALGLIADPGKTPGASDAAKDLAWKGKWNMRFYPDTWDGYEWAREKLYTLSRRAGAGDLIFLTGDSHSFWANRLSDAAGRPTGIELGTAGITSPGDFAASLFGPGVSARLDRAFVDHNPEVVWTDNMHQGYVRLVLEHGGAQAAFVAVDTVLSQDYSARVLKRYAIARKAGKLQLSEHAGVIKA